MVIDKMYKIVVLMSTYNGEKYLREQIDSILAQQGCDVELFIRDDGSKDTTTQILDEYKAKGQLDWYPGENLGPGKSFFELSLHAPDAEYYAFADQDDYWMPDKLSCAINMIEAEKCKDIPTLYCSKCTVTDAELKPLAQQEKKNYGKITLGHALMENIAAGCTYVFNVTAMQEFRKFNIKNIYIHDWVLYSVVIAIGGKVLFDDTPHILYRQHGNNAIGFGTRDLQHWKKRFKRKGKNPLMRSTTAQGLYVTYQSSVSSENAELLMLLSDYTHCLKHKIQLLFRTDLFMCHFIDRVILRVLIMLNWL